MSLDMRTNIFEYTILTENSEPYRSMCKYLICRKYLLIFWQSGGAWLAVISPPRHTPVLPPLFTCCLTHLNSTSSLSGTGSSGTVTTFSQVEFRVVQSVRGSQNILCGTWWLKRKTYCVEPGEFQQEENIFFGTWWLKAAPVCCGPTLCTNFILSCSNEIALSDFPC